MADSDVEVPTPEPTTNQQVESSEAVPTPDDVPIPSPEQQKGSDTTKGDDSPVPKAPETPEAPEAPKAPSSSGKDQKKPDTDKKGSASDDRMTPGTETTQHGDGTTEIIDKYQINVNNIIVDITVETDDNEAVPLYYASIVNISDTTKLILEKIRQEFIVQTDFNANADDEQKEEDIRTKFSKDLRSLIKKYFPSIESKAEEMLVNYIMQENLGLGKIEILLKDPNIEEIVVNSHREPVWVYHRRHAWVKTNIKIVTEERIRHFSSMIARDVGKEITTLTPLLDAHLKTGDRINATLMPITSFGNTMTIRKFAADPWTITKVIRAGTMSANAAALIWLGIQNEMSMLVAGGTGSGKTSTLNVLANFFPPNQRIISIEDTRELTLPQNLHWVPMETRAANPEGKGEISMLDCMINTLRMRPDRIMVGEIRRAKEAQVALEAIHTGHSVYGTFHATNSEEVVMRMTHEPINIAKPVISALGMIIIQNRNRRNGKRRTLQIAEVLPTGDPNTLLQLDPVKDILVKVRDSEEIMHRLNVYTGMTRKEISADIDGKVKVLKWMLMNNIDDIHEIGLIFSRYYRGKLSL